MWLFFPSGMYNKLIQINLKMIDVNSFWIIIVMCLFWHFHSYYLTRKYSIIPIQIIQNHFYLGQFYIGLLIWGHFYNCVVSSLKKDKPCSVTPFQWSDSNFIPIKSKKFEFWNFDKTIRIYIENEPETRKHEVPWLSNF